MPRILIVDDDTFIRTVVANLLTRHGYDITAASSGEEALQILRGQIFDLMISDVEMVPMNGLELLQKVRASYANMAVVMLTSQDSIDVAVGAMKKGAFDFLVKPFRPDELYLAVQRTLGCYSAPAENNPAQTQPEPLTGLVTESAGMREVCDMVKRIAPANITVLLCGESGTGKELIARALHFYSLQKYRAFAALDCAAIPAERMESALFGSADAAAEKGLLEPGPGGTLFLDNIDAMPLSIQSKLLDVIKTRKSCKLGASRQTEVDVRLVVSSGENPDVLIGQGRLDENLYDRLRALRINIPPLRNRREDILPLVDYFLHRNSTANVPVLDPKAKEILYNYTWPGNVAELEEAIRYALPLLQNGVITKEMLPVKIVTAFEDGVRAGVITSREQFKGQSFKALS
jgi:two-component system response regulator PilR (NtrC family)